MKKPSPPTSSEDAKALELSVVESLPAGLLMLDGRGVACLFNRAAESILQVERRQVLGRSYLELECLEPLRARIAAKLPGAEKPAELDGVHRPPAAVTLAQKSGLRQQAVELIRPSGDRIWLGFTLTPVAAGAEEGGGLLVHFTDISEKRRLESAMIQSDKLTTLGTMAGALAHEINNPMTVLLGSLELLIEEVDRGQPSLADRLRRMERTCWQCVDIVRTFLKVSRSSLPATGQVYVQEVLKDLLTLLGKQLALARVELKQDIPPDTPAVQVNRTELQQVLLNLMINARDAMPSGGTLTLRARADGAGVVIEVSDTGEGISREVLPHIFEHFFTTKEPGRGTGLGLAICRSLISEHHGEMWVESAVGRGTSFFVRLPRAKVAKAEPQAPGPRRAAQDSLGLEILCVDDEPDVLRLLDVLLRRAGCRVMKCQSAAEALRAFEKGQFHLAIVDYQMPGMNGLDLRRKLDELDPELPVLMVTGTILHDFNDVVRNENVLGCLAKPFTEQELRNWLVRVAQARGAGPVELIPGPPGGRKRRVLVVDDDVDFLAMMAHLLEASRVFTVHTAESALDGISKAERLTPDLVLLDVMMPGVDGLEACRRLRANPKTNRLPIVMLSARDDLRIVVQALSAGAIHYLMKPVDPIALPEKLLEILAAESHPRGPA